MLVTIITGNEVLLITVGLLSLIGVFEFLRVFKLEKKLPGLFAYAATIGLSEDGYQGPDRHDRGLFPASDVGLCAYLSDVQQRGDICRFYRVHLCSAFAFVHLSAADGTGREVPGLADRHRILGQRHLCILHGHAV